MGLSAGRPAPVRRGPIGPAAAVVNRRDGIRAPELPEFALCRSNLDSTGEGTGWTITRR
ncbi:hypothetical protein KPATCC21470_0814 [Kitasatospora purpeofusca]